jgi:hypothetical protein
MKEHFFGLSKRVQEMKQKHISSSAQSVKQPGEVIGNSLQIQKL